MKIPIVVIAYNRHESLKRLLNSLNNAIFNNDEVDLIISIDKGDNKKVVQIAKEFYWQFGKKHIIEHSQNLGLREHVLRSGDIVFDYDAIIMLEDDLVVSRSFYKYAKQSVEYYKNDKNIGGLSLYTYRITEFANYRTFIPLQDESDVFFMQVPSSWGQIWTKEQWMSFRDWYDSCEFKNNNYKGIIPDVALNWGESSWKKYFYMYITEQNKYIVYPRIGLSTNMADIGTHHKFVSTAHQSVLMGEFNRNYIFKEFDHSICIYDAFFENQYLKKFLSLDDNVLIDYYGIKEINNSVRYILTTRKLNFKVKRQWGLSLKPYELNIIYDIKGEQLFLYDSWEITKENKINNEINLIKYELPGITKEKSIRVAVSDYKFAIKRRLLKLFRLS